MVWRGSTIEPRGELPASDVGLDSVPAQKSQRLGLVGLGHGERVRGRRHVPVGCVERGHSGVVLLAKGIFTLAESRDLGREGAGFGLLVGAFVSELVGACPRHRHSEEGESRPSRP